MAASSGHILFDRSRNWSGTAENLADQVRRKSLALHLKAPPPTLRTIRLWRSRRLLTRPPTGDFRYRQILEALATSILLTRRWTLFAISEILPTLPDAIIETNILADAAGLKASWVGSPTTEASSPSFSGKDHLDRAEEAVLLLAQGILLQYDRVLNNEIVRQDDGIPPELQAAMCRLGRLYIDEGKEDRAACAHDVLDRARYSLNAPQWGLSAFEAPAFRLGLAILIDPDLKVPTPDCMTIANMPGTFGEENLLEHRLHTKLRDAASRCGRMRDSAYTAIRELLGRRSLISEQDFIGWLAEKTLTPLQQCILEEFFQPVPDIWLIDGHAHRCGNCGTLMRPHPDKNRFPDGRCPIPQCNRKFSPVVADRLDPRLGLHVAKPQILTYWTGPSIDELAIYDQARRSHIEAELYPEADLCDVALGGRAVGIDAKSYASPISLALCLNRDIGGLINYDRRIIAVGDEHIETNRDYLATLRSSLGRRGEPSTLEVMSVSSLLQMIRSRTLAN